MQDAWVVLDSLFHQLEVCLESVGERVFVAQVDLAHLYGFLVHDQTIRKVLHELILDAGVVKRRRYNRSKLQTLLFVAHVVRVACLILSLQYTHRHLSIVERNLVLFHVRIDTANVDKALRQVSLLCLTSGHLLLDLHNFLKISNRDVFLRLLLIVHAEVVVRHGQAPISIDVMAHWTQLVYVQLPELLQLVTKRFSLFKHLLRSLSFFPLDMADGPSIGLDDLLDLNLHFFDELLGRLRDDQALLG